MTERRAPAIGASVAVAGVCLTVVEVTGEGVAFDVIDETLRVTTLGELSEGAEVNIERAARFGDEIGGHQLSGHVSGTGVLSERVDTPDNCRLTLRLPQDLRPYVLPKGFVSIDGVSLTVGEVSAEAGTFHVHLIPETLRRTTLGEATTDGRHNIEIDAMTQAVVDTVRRVRAQNP